VHTFRFADVHISRVANVVKAKTDPLR